MHQARHADSWEPDKPERFRRDSAQIAFTEAQPDAGLFERLAPALLGSLAGAGLATVAWLWLGWFRV